MNEKRLSVEELITAYNREKDSDVVKRLMLVILVERDGMYRTEAALSLGRARSWGVKWYGRYLREAPARTADKTAARQAAFCFQEDHEEDLEDGQRETTCWTAKALLDLIKTMSGIKYEISHVRALLRGRGYTMKVPVGRHVRRANRQKIAGFQRRMRRLIPKKGANGYIRCVQDETIVIADARARRGVYTLKGKRAVYTYTGSHARTVVFGMITDDGRSFFKRYERFTKDEFADFLKEACREFGKPIMMILDRAPQHKAKIIQETLRDLDGAIDLEFLPPGCPDLNAIEEVWRQMKRAVLDIPYVTVATMHEDIRQMAGLIGPRTGHRKVPLPNGLGAGLLPAHCAG